MAQYEVTLRNLTRDAALPPSLVRLCIPAESPADNDHDAAEDAWIIAARLGGVARFD